MKIKFIALSAVAAARRRMRHHALRRGVLRQGRRPHEGGLQGARPGQARPHRPGRAADACARIYRTSHDMPKDVAAQIEKEQLATIKYPADGKFLGDWKKGERIAQSGRGGQYNDDPKQPVGRATATPATSSRSRRSPTARSGRASTTSRRLRGYGPDIQKYASEQGLQLARLRRLLEHAAVRAPRDPHRGADQGRRGALLMDPNSPGEQIGQVGVSTHPGAGSQPALFSSRNISHV